MSPAASVIIAASERDADLYYATRFVAPDAFVYLQVHGHTQMIMSDLEVDRATSQARVDTVHAYSRLARAYQREHGHPPSMYAMIASLLRQQRVLRVEVPAAMSIQHVEGLRRAKLDVTFRPDPFFPERVIKTAEEIGHIRATVHHTEAAIEMAIDLVRRSDIRGDELILGGKPLTVEYLKKVMQMHLMEHECVAQHTIVACGVQACDPHEEGHGPLRPHQSIVFDVFPQHMHSRYYGDISRTVVRGQASPKLKRMYAAVRQGQEIAFGMLKAGVDGREIHTAIVTYFDHEGFKSGEQEGRVQGFFHGTGHGLGLEVHEPPRVSGSSETLLAGTVVTVEPGLYYLDAGGVRIEDDVVVTATGCENLSHAPKVLEI